MTDGLTAPQIVEVNTPKCGRFIVRLQRASHNPDTSIVTVHDLGCNARQYLPFLDNPNMQQIAKRFNWIHIQLPGQGENDQDFSSDYKFPTIQDIADDLINVVNQLNIKNMVLFGEGAGANILARFAIAHNDLVLGAILIHVVGTAASFFAKTNRRLSVTSRLSSQGMHPAAEEYLIKHRFGAVNDNSHRELIDEVDAYKDSLNSCINPKNLNQYIISYMNRTSIKERIKEIRCPVLFLTGTLSVHNSSVVDLHSAMQRALQGEPLRRSKVELLQVDGVANVLTEKPDKVAECFQYFLQGLGLVGGMRMLHLSSDVHHITSHNLNQAFVTSSDQNRLAVTGSYNSSRRLSMQDFDTPRGVEAYSSAFQRKGSCAIEQ